MTGRQPVEPDARPPGEGVFEGYDSRLFMFDTKSARRDISELVEER